MYAEQFQVLYRTFNDLKGQTFWDFFTKHVWILHNCVKINNLENCLIITWPGRMESLVSFATISISTDKVFTPQRTF